MKFKAKGNADFKLPPVGNHVAICNMVVDLGLQPQKGQYPEPKHRVYIRFELCKELHTYKDKNEKEVTAPMVIGQEFTASMSKKSLLRPFIESMFGKQFEKDEAAAAFDFHHVLGRKCLLNVVHDDRGDKVYANVKTATPLPKGMNDDSKPYNPLLYFSLEEPDAKMFDALPEWLRKKIQNRIPEEKAEPISSGVTVPADGDDDIPF